ncbi:MAG: phosphatidylinositol transfer protein [Nannocystaceae bacterium]
MFPRSLAVVVVSMTAALLLACPAPAEVDGSGSATLGPTSTTVGTDDGSDSTASASATAGEPLGTGSSDGADTTADTTADSGDTTTGPPIMCEPVPDCDALPPDAGPTLDWQSFESNLIAGSGSPRHRGRDMFYNPDDTHWVMAKFAYGPTDWDLAGERIDMFLLRNCMGDWEPLGPIFTTDDGQHPTVEGVEDSGGWVYFQMPSALPVGRHRIHMVVRGDDTRADTYIEVVEPGTPIIVSDIDGTLTTSEWERLVDFLLSTIPDVNEGAPQALHALVDLGYRPMYLTARPEFLGRRTYEFIELRGLPPGIIHTTLSATGALGGAAVDYKTAELAALASRGLVPSWVFGNSSSDAEAYDNAGILPLSQRVFFQYEDTFGGRTIDSYLELLPELQGLDPVCE